jgi:protein TonB
LSHIARISLVVVFLHAMLLWQWRVNLEPLPGDARDFVVHLSAAPVPAMAPALTPVKIITSTAKPVARPKTQLVPPQVLVNRPSDIAPLALATGNATPQSTTTQPPSGASPQPAHDPHIQSAPNSQVAVSAAPALQLPSANADYLNNPAPGYPAISQRLGEQGKVVVRVLIGKNGAALKSEIAHSSGYDRLDEAALRAVTGWRYVPGQRAGVVQDMWFNVPVNFALN